MLILNSYNNRLDMNLSSVRVEKKTSTKIILDVVWLYILGNFTHHKVMSINIVVHIYVSSWFAI